MGGRIYRQFNLGRYGIVDLLSVDIEMIFGCTIEIKCVELKKEKMKLAHIAQLGRYMTGIKSMTSKVQQKYGRKIRLAVTGTLIVPEVETNSDIVFLTNHLSESIEILTYNFSLEDGLVFEDLGKEWFLKEASLSETDFRNWKYKNYMPLYESSILKEFMIHIKPDLNGQAHEN